MAEKKQDIRVIFKVGGWLAFIMLGYLGLRGYRQSIEKLKANACEEEIFELVSNIQGFFVNSADYGNLDYKQMVSFNLIPKKMFKEGYNEATNSYYGGIDFYYSFLDDSRAHAAYEVSFQGLSSYGCMRLLRMNWGTDGGSNVIAVAAYPVARAAGPLDEIYPETSQKDIKSPNIFKYENARYLSDEKAKDVCSCEEYDCSVIWKFR